MYLKGVRIWLGGGKINASPPQMHRCKGLAGYILILLLFFSLNLEQHLSEYEHWADQFEQLLHGLSWTG